jgi:hypothetical protein
MTDPLIAVPRNYSIEVDVEGTLGAWGIRVNRTEKMGSLSIMVGGSPLNDTDGWTTVEMLPAEWEEFATILKLAASFVEQSIWETDEAEVV